MIADGPLDAWLRLVRDEYFERFVPAGGAAVKFVITASPADAGDMTRRLADLARGSGLQFAAADAAFTKIHLIDQLFYRVAAQLNWQELARLRVAELLTADGFIVPDGAANFDQLASVNQHDQALLRGRLHQLLLKHVFQDYAMVPEFRMAMLHLGQAALEPGEDGAQTSLLIEEWLRGQLRPMSALKSYHIFQKISRYNARHMFLSLVHWLRACGKRGLVLVLDISRYLDVARSADLADGFHHSSSATLDAYEVLREFIDETDDLEGCFIAVTAPREFLTDEKRGLSRYDALKLRIWDEVHDRLRPNPASSLVRLQAYA